MQFFAGPSKCGRYDVLWETSDWDESKSVIAWLPKGALIGSALWEALLTEYWKAEKLVEGWEEPNFNEVITDEKAALSPEAVWKIVDQIWPPR